MKVLFCHTINPGVSFYRLYQFAQKMSELGLAHCRIFPEWDVTRFVSPDWERNIQGNIDEIEAQVAWADVIVCQYINSPEGLSIVQAMRDIKPTLMEVDDYFKQVSYQSMAYEYNRPGDIQDLWATRQLIESTGVIVSTPWLAAQYKEFNENIKVIPNCIDFDLWDAYKPEVHDKVRIGWVGGATHEGDLKMIKNALVSLLQAHTNCEVCIVSAPPPLWESHERLHMMNQWVNIDKYAEHVKHLSFDVGLVPLRDNLFNRGKSNLRALEYSACRIPTVASKVEPYKNGLPLLHAITSDDWVAHLEHYIVDDKARRSDGQTAYDYVKEHYNLDNVAVEYANHLKEYL